MSTDAAFEQLKHPNPHLRERAMEEIANNRDVSTIPRLMSVMNSEDVVYRRAAVKTLGLIGIEAVSPLVDAMLTSENVTVRGSCAKALAQIALNYPEETFPEIGMQGLKQAMNDVNPVVNIAAVMALGEIGTPAFDILVEAIETTDNVALAVSITNAFASIADEKSIELLTVMSGDDSLDPYVQETAISALSRVELVKRNQPNKY